MVSGAATSADLPTKAPISRAGCAQAVDGLTGKVGGFGGSVNNSGYYGGTGSFAAPLGCEWGFQLDGSAASFDSRFVGTVAGHLFWRDPAKGLLGLYGNYSYWAQGGGVRASHVGPEAEWYLGRWTLQGVAGVEFGNTTTAAINGSIVTYDIDTRFFDQVNLAYYLNDDFKVYLGHRYTFGKHAAAAGVEWGIPMQRGVMAALFTEGRLGESGNHAVWGGLRFYFGQSDKTLIRRHREDDPDEWVGLGASSAGGTSSSGAAGQQGCTPSQTAFVVEGCGAPPPPP